jgi:hypothetical protein
MPPKSFVSRSICLSLFALLGISAFTQQPASAPKLEIAKSQAKLPGPITSTGTPPASILLIRHAEKLTDGQIDLSPTGYQRARLLPTLFTSGKGDLPSPQFIFATHQSKHSNRPVETVTPLAAALHLSIDSTIANEDYASLAAELLSGKYAGKVVLVAWHHGTLPALVTVLGVQPPYTSWPDQQFDRVWRIDFRDGKATIRDLPQHLLPGDSN